jgi:hypothetical protein
MVSVRLKGFVFILDGVFWSGNPIICVVESVDAGV